MAESLRGRHPNARDVMLQLDPMYAAHTRYGTNWWVGDTVLAGIARATGRPPAKELMAEAFEALHEKSLGDYDRLLDDYYRLRGCDIKTGIPSRDALEKVGLSYVAADMERRGRVRGAGADRAAPA